MNNNNDNQYSGSRAQPNPPNWPTYNSNSNYNQMPQLCPTSGGQSLLHSSASQGTYAPATQAPIAGFPSQSAVTCDEWYGYGYDALGVSLDANNVVPNPVESSLLFGINILNSSLPNHGNIFMLHEQLYSYPTPLQASAQDASNQSLPSSQQSMLSNNALASRSPDSLNPLNTPPSNIRHLHQDPFHPPSNYPPVAPGHYTLPPDRIGGDVLSFNCGTNYGYLTHDSGMGSNSTENYLGDDFPAQVEQPSFTQFSPLLADLSVAPSFSPGSSSWKARTNDVRPHSSKSGPAAKQAAKRARKGKARAEAAGVRAAKTNPGARAPRFLTEDAWRKAHCNSEGDLLEPKQLANGRYQCACRATFRSIAAQKERHGKYVKRKDCCAPGCETSFSREDARVRHHCEKHGIHNKCKDGERCSRKGQLASRTTQDTADEEDDES